MFPPRVVHSVSIGHPKVYTPLSTPLGYIAFRRGATAVGQAVRPRRHIPSKTSFPPKSFVRNNSNRRKLEYSICKLP